MRQIQQIAEAPAGAVQIKRALIGEVYDYITEQDIGRLASFLCTDIALELKGPILWLWSIKVQEGA